MALDVWYNLLYKEIDAKYPFDDNLMNMNPMQRRQLCLDGSIKCVCMDDGRKLVLHEDGTCEWDGSGDDASNFEWMPDETSSEFVYIWDSEIWRSFYNNSQAIRSTRRECTTPRGVLEKVQRIVRGLEYKWSAYVEQRDEDGDYIWFKQQGKVYTHWQDKSQFTKFVNLHLGAAYDAMTGKEYWELTKTDG